MRKLLILFAVVTTMLAASCNKYDDSALTGRMDNLENRVERLETLCNQMNTNISSLQTLVNALQQNDYVTSVTPIVQNGVEVGYTISFAKSSPITIYHGKDGAKGDRGEQGIQGEKGDTYVPFIGVKQDIDGIYYWTLDGDWLLCDGKKVKATGQDGAQGEKGDSGLQGDKGDTGAQGPQGDKGDTGAIGPQGPQGADGITPKLKIENGYWYVSYDNGATWEDEPLGKATGDNGNDGSDANSIKITEDEYNVYFELPDGTVITISKSGAGCGNGQYNSADLIRFEDINVKKICVQNWDTNHDGELSYEEAAAVTSIGTAFSQNKDIQLFNEFKYFVNVAELEEGAFRSCSNLWYITLPNSITKIGNYAFYACSAIIDIKLPKNLLMIGNSTFYATNPTGGTIIIPKSVQSIGENAFHDFKGSKIEFEPQSELTDLGVGAFFAAEITDICIPKGVKVIQPKTFYLCRNLTKVSFEEGSLLTTVQAKIQSSGGGTLYQAFGSTALIEFDASNCKYLSEIETYVFNDNSSSYNAPPITIFKIGAMIPPTCSSNTFYAPSKATLYVPKESIEVYRNTSVWKNFKSIVALEDLE